jgi:tetratricopeptide (TPR) repeat protein
VTAAKAAAAKAPKSYDARIRYARALYIANLYPAALPEYIAAAKLDLTQAEPVAYTGWLTALFARTETDATQRRQLFDAAVSSLDRAIAVDPTYPDSYVFKGLLLTQIQNKQCAGAAAFQQFLAIAPADHALRPQVLSLLEQAVKAGKCPTTLPTTPTTKP